MKPSNKWEIYSFVRKTLHFYDFIFTRAEYFLLPHSCTFSYIVLYIARKKYEILNKEFSLQKNPSQKEALQNAHYPMAPPVECS